MAMTIASDTPTLHLIVVCCHAIYLGPPAGPGTGPGSTTGPELETGLGSSSSSTPSFASDNEANWLIEPFQKGETGTYIAHNEAGVRELATAVAKGEDALLVFSGGATKLDKTGKSEGEGYLDVAIERNFFGLETSPPTLRRRMFVDRFATDSYQNILCSIIQFPHFVRELLEREASHRNLGSGSKPNVSVKPETPSASASSVSSSTASASASASLVSELKSNTNISATTTPFFPTKLTIVSHDFKRSRFLNLHLPAIHWPSDKETETQTRTQTRTHFIGINPPFDDVKMAEIETGDRLRGYGAWEKDLYGAGALLAGKRKTRGWQEERFRREVLGQTQLSAELKVQIEKMLAWKGGENGTDICPAPMPWE
ncbi:hypothetical protein A1O1_00711 [Capronia coronata CBS 617.96]|uniref:Uncharacterized protein n=1 Tax=Capronia coronata CBS 617.96 TaxID=1182541 RepID=W9ZM69_9EURO|nr:uncharacterized protein A1O1_00711 [Capronia coronata CBS 617.96]EXJ95589.1 hypothetical protein A1O1_00711 [Capronia coronata CBS 617.96]